MLSPQTLTLAEKTLNLLKSQGLTMTTAESCTGGLIFSALTDFSGSSMVMDRGFITYSNASKMAQLDVTPETIAKFGAVSEATVSEMLLGALDNSTAHIAVAISGIAGSNSDSGADTATSVQCGERIATSVQCKQWNATSVQGEDSTKPQGLVYIGTQSKGNPPTILQNHFQGNRQTVREQSVITALHMIQQTVMMDIE